LSSEQERVCVRFARVDDGVSEESDDGHGDQGGIEVPVGEGAGDLLIEGLEKDGHVAVFSARERVWLRARELVSECLLVELSTRKHTQLKLE
jgi:hypothetical protein